MKISRPKLILNPYDWLPGYGESKVSFRSVGVDVMLDVEYERELPGVDDIDAVQNLRREIGFKSVRAFMRFPFPGKDFFEFDGDSTTFRLGDLTEFLDSDLVKVSLEAWCSMSGSRSLALRHFSIQFLSENVSFHILAEDVFLSDECLVC